MLELKNISFGVSESTEQKEILKDISLTIKDGTFTAITGPNGGGNGLQFRVKVFPLIELNFRAFP